MSPARPTSARPKGASASKAVALTPEVATKVGELKGEANQLFLAKDYQKALDAFDAAIKLVPESAVERVELQQKKAGCLLTLKKYKEAAKECSNILEQQPAQAAALKTRAKAYEQQGLFKQALSDIQAVNKTDAANDETRNQEKRLKDAMSGRARLTSSSASRAASPVVPNHLTVKVTLGNDSKLLYVNYAVSYPELYQAVREKFPSAGPFVMKWIDKDGDLVTITRREDFQMALAEVIIAFQKAQAGPQKGMTLPPPVKIQVLPVASEADVPPFPAEELAQARAARGESEQALQQPRPPVDEWTLDFQRLVQEVTGIDVVAHYQNLVDGSDKLVRVVNEAYRDPKMLPLLDQAETHFRDGAISMIVQWANIHIVRAEHLAFAAAKEGRKLEGEALEAILKEVDLAEQRLTQFAGPMRTDSWEVVATLGQLHWERIKWKMNYVVLPVAPPEDAAGKSPEQIAAEQAAATGKCVAEALTKLEAARLAECKKHVEEFSTLFESAMAHAKLADDAKKAKQEEAEKGQPKKELSAEEARQQQMALAQSQVLIIFGNQLYEWSQVLAGLGQEWRPTLDLAVEKFRASGAAELDIRAALKNHVRKDDLDLGPDPEPEVPAAAPAAEAPKEKKAEKKAEAKGLPSLEVKGKKK